jgi:outer membrane beta-barrel protein
MVKLFKKRNEMRFLVHQILLFSFISFNSWAEVDTKLDYREIDKIEEVLETNFLFEEETASGKNDILPDLDQKTRQKSSFKEMEKTFYFNDLAVIQKNYMPKTERYQLSVNVASVPSDAFYSTLGLALKGSYHFNENWGAEVFTHIFSSTARDEVSNIASKNLVKVSNLVSLKSFSGFNIYNNFIYGKLSVEDKRVLPFEIYSTFGLGSLMTSKDDSSPSIQIGAGSLFSLDRSGAFRLELTWALYQTQLDQLNTSIENSTFFAIGYSWFWPHPEYR